MYGVLLPRKRPITVYRVPRPSTSSPRLPDADPEHTRSLLFRLALGLKATSVGN